MKLKIFLIFLGIIVVFSDTTAQDSEEKITRKKHEINLGFTNLFSPWRNNYQPAYYPYYDTYSASSLPPPTGDFAYYPPYTAYENNPSQFGLGYKFHFGSFAARALFAFRSKSDDNSYEPNTLYNSSSSSSYDVLGLRIGIERTLLRLKRFDFYIAIDGIYSSSNQKSESTSINFPSNDMYKSKSTTDNTFTGAGLGIGFRYFFHQNFSISTETQIDYTDGDIKTKYESSSMGTNNYSATSSSKRQLTSSIIKPFSILSLNVHF